MRYIGGGHKQKNREVDFKRDKDGIPGVVNSIEYDPGRTARIALIFYKDGEKEIYYCSNRTTSWTRDYVWKKSAEPEVGNTLFLSDIPLGTVIHNVELRPNVKELKWHEVLDLMLNLQQRTENS